ncbi:MAG TPA: hypothetical protein VJT72_10170 [Pseudonocardiaceae bacterium]|nr:hypothetical protein [Pseudonocardiaceae bacterium]
MSVNDDWLTAALRAQASGLGSGSPVPSSHHLAQPRTRWPAWVVLALAVLLGTMAGGLAGLISTW